MGRKGYYEKTRLILKLKATKKMARNTTRLNPNNVAIAANIEQARLVAGFLLSVAATSGYKRLQAATSGYKRLQAAFYPKVPKTTNRSGYCYSPLRYWPKPLVTQIPRTRELCAA